MIKQEAQSTLLMNQHDEEKKPELEIISEMVNEALSKAVQSMERMLKIRVRAEHIDLGYGSLDYIPEFEALGRFKVHVVKVVFKGEINGAFYFIMNGHEVDLINSVCLPEGMSAESRAANKMMKHGFMSEIENMIAALSIKVISEFLGVQLLWEVPEIQIMEGSQVNEYLRSENFTNNTAFHVQSVLAGVVVNISPFFLWMVDDQFLNKLRLNM